MGGHEAMLLIELLLTLWLLSYKVDVTGSVEVTMIATVNTINKHLWVRRETAKERRDVAWRRSNGTATFSSA